MNLASRLQAQAEPGCVLISEATHGLVAGLVETAFASEDAGNLTSAVGAVVIEDHGVFVANLGHRSGRGVLPLDDHDGLVVQPELLPGDAFERLVERAEPAGQNGEGVRPLDHALLALVHGADDDEFA